MAGLLVGKVALITGAARGQGRAHAVQCAQEGADVVLVDIATQIATVPYPMASLDNLKETARLVEATGRRALTCEADVRSQEELDASVASAVGEFGQLDILIANAGIWSLTPFWELTDRDWQDMLDVNLTGVWHSAKAVAPHMMERETGSIIMISSMNGLVPGPTYAHYTAAKHGVIGLMKTVALELAPFGVRCNAICPGAIDTPMTDSQYGRNVLAGHDHGTREEMMEAGYRCAALRGRSFLPPEVIAKAALYLNSDLADSVTGAVLPVDSGQLLLPGFNHAPVRE